MKFVDEFRDPDKAQSLTREIAQLLNRIETPGGRPLQLMEFCGGHTHTIFRYGIEQMLPGRIEMVHGPGCPVCVLPMGRVDDCVAMAERPEIIFTTFGDAMRVPGTKKSLLQAKGDGADIRMVYSPLDALELARKNPDREVVFFALGFETTMPSTALTLLQADAEGLENFSLFCNHITTVPTLQAILDDPDLMLDGFLAPGHVSMVLGEQPFEFVAREYHKPIVITGFEPLDILHSIYMVVKQLAEGCAEVENQYARVVEASGNTQGQAAINKVYELKDSVELRGLGSIDHSGVRIREEFAQFDAEQKFPIPARSVADPDQPAESGQHQGQNQGRPSQCGEVLKGAIRPWQCRLFGTECTPATPLGALMVSSEGACAAYYSYGDLEELLARRDQRV